MANPATPNGALKTVPVPGTPVLLAAAKTPSKVIRLIPMKTAGAANTGVIYIGLPTMVKATGVGVYATLRPTDQGITINIGDLMNSDFFDLNTWAVDADTANDGVFVGFIN